MREKLNENPIAQAALIGILAVVGVVMFIGQSGGGEEEESAAPTEATVAVAGTGASATATGSTPGEAVESAVSSLEAGAGAVAAAPPTVPTPSPPKRLIEAYESGKTVALLIVHPGSIDSAFSAQSSLLLAPYRDVRLFVVKAKEIARYAAITVGLEVNRVPALVVMKPKRLSHGTPQATVDYGLQTPQSVAQAILDANYHGRELAYHPN
ncbi:MAG: hypothetical protein ACRDLL_06295 [Solirubrobacterales bacterium]